MPEPLNEIRFGWNEMRAGKSVNGQTFAGNSILYAGPWIYVRENLGIVRVNALSGLAQFAAACRIFGTASPIVGRFSTPQDSYQCLTRYDISERWLVHNGFPTRGWHAGTEQMSTVQIWRADGTVPDYQGQVSLEELADTGYGSSSQPVIVGDSAYIMESSDTPPKWTRLDLLARTVVSKHGTLPVAIDNYLRRVDRQNSIDGATYEFAAEGLVQDGMQRFILRRTGTVTPTVPPPTPPTLEPPTPEPEEPPVPTEPEECPPGQKRNFMGQCVSEEEPTPPPVPVPIEDPNYLDFTGGIAIHLIVNDPRLPGLAIAKAIKLTGGTGAFHWGNPDSLEVIVKVIDGRAVNGRWWIFAAGLTDVGCELVATKGDKIKRYSNAQGTAFQPILHTTAFAA